MIWLSDDWFFFFFFWLDVLQYEQLNGAISHMLSKTCYEWKGASYILHVVAETVTFTK